MWQRFSHVPGGTDAVSADAKVGVSADAKVGVSADAKVGDASTVKTFTDVSSFVTGNDIVFDFAVVVAVSKSVAGEAKALLEPGVKSGEEEELGQMNLQLLAGERLITEPEVAEATMDD